MSIDATFTRIAMHVMSNFQDGMNKMFEWNDTVLTGMILNDKFSNYTQEVMSFVDWCDSNHLALNVRKTKEMIIDFGKQTKVPDLTVIKKKRSRE